MSLKAFHLFFISISILISAYFGGWSFQNYRTAEETSYLVFGIAALVSMLGMTVYLGWFLKKSKDIGFLSILALAGLSYGQVAEACTACMSNTKSPLIQATNDGVVFLLGVVGVVLVAFAALFIFWWRRSLALPR